MEQELPSPLQSYELRGKQPFVSDFSHPLRHAIEKGRGPILYIKKKKNGTPRGTIIDKVIKLFDKSVKAFKPSGEYTSANTEEDILTLVKSSRQRRVFDFIPGRSHSQFENIKSDPYQSLEGEVMRDWISASLKNFLKNIFIEGSIVIKN